MTHPATRRISRLAGHTLLLAAATVGLFMAASVAQEGGKSGLKGLSDTPMNETNPAPDVIKQQVPAGGFGRAYRQQPPLIPHKVEGYQITTENNACMSCHDWPGNTRVNAPKISETHYVDRQGVRLDKVAGTRYFCQQCHVPQADAKPLVGNAFQNATQAK
jgi:nitrate reductase (cytochrome), electron transfer subunit